MYYKLVYMNVVVDVYFSKVQHKETLKPEKGRKITL